MGAFDTVLVPCPKCGTKVEFQSKGATSPSMHTYELAETPPDVLADVNRHSPHSCHNCAATFSVRLTPTTKLTQEPPDVDQDT